MEHDIHFPGVVIKASYARDQPVHNEPAFNLVVSALMCPFATHTPAEVFMIGTHSFIGAN